MAHACHTVALIFGDDGAAYHFPRVLLCLCNKQHKHGNDSPGQKVKAGALGWEKGWWFFVCRVSRDEHLLWESEQRGEENLKNKEITRRLGKAETMDVWFSNSYPTLGIRYSVICYINEWIMSWWSRGKRQSSHSGGCREYFEEENQGSFENALPLLWHILRRRRWKTLTWHEAFSQRL